MQMTMLSHPEARNRRTALVLAGVVVAMVGLAYASVPLYRLFCQVTGFTGVPRTVDVAPAPGVQTDGPAMGRVVSMMLDANVNKGLDWKFYPLERYVSVPVGEEVTTYYRATNMSDVPLVGTATFNVTPFLFAPYFSKMECFCFTEQRLEPGESMDMPVTFYIDPDMMNDIEAQHVDNIALSYTFHPVSPQDT